MRYIVDIGDGNDLLDYLANSSDDELLYSLYKKVYELNSKLGKFDDEFIWDKIAEDYDDGILKLFQYGVDGKRCFAYNCDGVCLYTDGRDNANIPIIVQCTEFVKELFEATEIIED